MTTERPTPIEAPRDPRPVVDVVIPVLDERKSIGLVLGDLPTSILREVIVVDNGSVDGTAEIARGAGATVIDEPRRGYGRACLDGTRRTGRSKTAT